MLLSQIAHWTIWLGVISARADLPTGRQIPVVGPVSECSQPPADSPRVYTYQLSSRFTFYVCREFRSAESGAAYFVLGPADDGEYIRLLAPPGRPVIDPDDYRRNRAVAVKTCEQIRESVLRRAVPLDKTSCQGQAPP